MNNFKKALIIFSSVFLLSACAQEIQPEIENTTEPPIIEQVEIPEVEEPTPEPEPEPEPTYITFGAVGDNLIHSTVIKDGITEDGGYDYTHLYEKISPLIQSVDIAFINQEAPMSKDHDPSGYPTFNSPPELAEFMVDAGFDVVNLANNHSLDKGKTGVLNTIELWDSFEDIVHFGMYSSEEDSNTLRTIVQDDITIGFLTYTYGTNGISLPSDMPYIVPLIDKDKITADVTLAQENCDVLIVSMHWGYEYHLTENTEQNELASLLNSLGVDVVIGHHPHVIQPVEILTNEQGKDTLVFYSLGNFISGQDEPNRMLGAFAEFTIMKDIDGEISIINPSVTPIVTYYKSWANFVVMPLSEYTEEYSSNHALVSKGNVSREYFEQLFADTMGEFYTPIA